MFRDTFPLNSDYRLSAHHAEQTVPALSTFAGTSATTSILGFDIANVSEFQHLAVPDPGDGSATLTHLTTEEQRAYRLLYTKGRLRIEQERIPFAHAITEIRKAFP